MSLPREPRLLYHRPSRAVPRDERPNNYVPRPPRARAKRDPTPGEKARQVRRSLSLRLADVAAAIGTNGGDLSKVERGLRPMSPAMLARIVGVLRRAGASEEQLRELETP